MRTLRGCSLPPAALVPAHVSSLEPFQPVGIVVIVSIPVRIIVLQARAAISLHSQDLILILHASIFRPQAHRGYYALLGQLHARRAACLIVFDDNALWFEFSDGRRASMSFGCVAFIRISAHRTNTSTPHHACQKTCSSHLYGDDECQPSQLRSKLQLQTWDKVQRTMHESKAGTQTCQTFCFYKFGLNRNFSITAVSLVPGCINTFWEIFAKDGEINLPRKNELRGS